MTMDRILIVEQLMHQKHRTTTAHEQYLSTLREYLPGSKLYMREVHFVSAASPDSLVSIADIAQKLEVTPGAVSQLASRLEKKGYITRQQNDSDRRQTLVALTEIGKALYEHHAAFDFARIKEFSNMLEQFSEEDLLKFQTYEEICYCAFLTKKSDVL